MKPTALAVSRSLCFLLATGLTLPNAAFASAPRCAPVSELREKALSKAKGQNPKLLLAMTMGGLALKKAVMKLHGVIDAQANAKASLAREFEASGKFGALRTSVLNTRQIQVELQRAEGNLRPLEKELQTAREELNTVRIERDLILDHEATYQRTLGMKLDSAKALAQEQEAFDAAARVTIDQLKTAEIALHDAEAALVRARSIEGISQIEERLAASLAERTALNEAMNAYAVTSFAVDESAEGLGYAATIGRGIVSGLVVGVIVSAVLWGIEKATGMNLTELIVGHMRTGYTDRKGTLDRPAILLTENPQSTVIESLASPTQLCSLLQQDPTPMKAALYRANYLLDTGHDFPKPARGDVNDPNTWQGGQVAL